MRDNEVKTEKDREMGFRELMKDREAGGAGGGRGRVLDGVEAGLWR